MKTVPQITAAEAAALVPEGAVLMAGGFGMTGNPSPPAARAGRAGRRRLNLHRQQRGRAGAGRRPAAAQRPAAQGHRLLLYLQPRSGQGLSGRRDRDSTDPTGLAGRGAAGRRRGHRRLLHPYRRRHRGGREHRDARHRRPGGRLCARPAGRRGLRARLAGRHGRQPGLPHDRAQLQPADGHGRPAGGGRGGGDRAGRRRWTRTRSIPLAASWTTWCRSTRRWKNWARRPRLRPAARRPTRAAWPWPAAPWPSCTTATWSTWASASRRWWPISSRRSTASRCTPRTACWASARRRRAAARWTSRSTPASSR